MQVADPTALILTGGPTGGEAPADPPKLGDTIPGHAGGQCFQGCHAQAPLTGASPVSSPGHACRTLCNRRATRHVHLGQLFESVATHRSEAAALTAASRCWTYSALLSAARTVAASLEANRDFHPGDRVIVLLPNSAEYVAGFYGVLLAGGVAVPVPPKTEAGLLRAIFDSTEAVAVITDSQVMKSRVDLQSLCREMVDFSEQTSAGADPSWPGTEDSGDELAAIFFTGGSSGLPKGVMLSHRNLISNARSIQQYLQITSSDRPLCILPFHHAFGNSVWQSHLLSGAHLILDGQTSFPETLIQALVRHECTSLSGVPDLFRMLLERSSLGQTRMPSLRYMAVAGGALPHDLALEMGRRVSPAEFFVMYGQTEATARLAYLPPELLGRLPQASIGRAVPGVTLDIVDEHDQPVAPGAVGELRAAGESVMLGYWRDPAATAERIRSGWLYTGDLATRDSDGWISLQGRSSSIVKIAGFRVQPADLEDFAVRRLSALQAVAVPCEMADVGTRLALYVRLDPLAQNLSLSEMIARCRAELPRHFVPELIQIVDAFPLNSALKIDRPLLKRQAEEARAAGRRSLA
jgi:acyl-CoA synthetase (AMP-forming)/AMP-acid ligase II